MNAIEIREFKEIIRDCENLRRENADLRVQVHDLKADLARFKLKDLLNKPVEGQSVIYTDTDSLKTLKEGEEE